MNAKQLDLGIVWPDDDSVVTQPATDTPPPASWENLLGTSAPIPVSMTTIGNLFRVGPTHHLIGHISGHERLGAFEFFPITGSDDAIGQDRSLWHGSSNTQRSLVVLPTHKGIPVVGRDQQKMRAQSGRLFYARNMSWASQTLVAALTEQDTMGGGSWAGLNHDDLRICKAFSLWANSTLGMIVHWTRGQRTHPGRSQTHIRLLHQMPCPKIDDLSDTALDFAATEFDDLAKRELSPACQAHVDATRQDIDSAVVNMLGMPFGVRLTIKNLCDQWCREPSVHGRNKAALAMIKPEFEAKGLTPDAERYNAPRHFRESLGAWADSDFDDSEILPISTPRIRRAFARRRKKQ